MAFQFPPLATMSALLRHSHASREHIRAFQDHHVRRLVTHAYENVPYYRRLFDQHGLKPGDIHGVTDLPRIPVTSRKTLQVLPIEDVVARNVDPQHLITHTTSGSSGVPFTTRRTWWESRLLQLFRLRAMHEYGLRVTDKIANLVLARPVHPRNTQAPLRLLRSLGLYRNTRINCLLPPHEIIRALHACAPDLIGGFAGVITQVSRYISEEDRRVIRPRFVTVGGEVLTSAMRRQIQEAFHAPVFDIYGSSEFIFLAWECKETGEFHTCDDSVIVEVLNEGRPVQEGERGEVVGTSLHSLAMPLIRYQHGDLVTKGAETCRCGQPYGVIRAVQGRMIDYFPLPDGRVIHPYEIVIPLIAESWVRQYQLVQERKNRFVLRIVPGRTPSVTDVEQLRNMTAGVVGPGVEFQVDLVPEIAIEPTGKFRVSRSLVRSAYDGIDWDDLQAATPSPVGERGNESH